MNNRRSLIEGLAQTPAVDPKLEEAFVFNKPRPEASEEAAPRAVSPPARAPPARAPPVRAPLSTRIRADMAAALKRASLERQLQGVQPNTLQDILEEAIEPWLKSHGYLP